ncbi:hypothetical protein BD324DRAFT_611085 [Kockovaella imperatae]|uniref:Uncharacterized protein n=1 Tax=Kockovaella imperatae TaxID=4999 RepID=A0A1Y1USK3_9TREE|nr:hypothetical protein BD324DRAFT_611085 [Kockovaella imperatae]ORX40514.1 hypothetical protein BD324DRAFT_611085 [Kockovaella imperatae]
MATPPTLLPGMAYIHVSTNEPSAVTSVKHQQWTLHHVGPVGELQGEHLFEVRQPGGTVMERSGLDEPALLQKIKDDTGLKGVKMVEMKQRVKRDEF